MAAIPLLERDDELAALRAVLDRAAGGTGGVVAIEGPAGIGKSGLLRAVQDLAADAGLEVLAARGGELEQEFPHGVVRQLVERRLLAGSDEERAAALAGPAALAAAALGLGGTAPGPGQNDA